MRSSIRGPPAGAHNVEAELRIVRALPGKPAGDRWLLTRTGFDDGASDDRVERARIVVSSLIMGSSCSGWSVRTMRSSAKRFACASSSPPSTSSSTEQPCAHSLGLGIDETMLSSA